MLTWCNSSSRGSSLRWAWPSFSGACAIHRVLDSESVALVQNWALPLRLSVNSGRSFFSLWASSCPSVKEVTALGCCEASACGSRSPVSSTILSMSIECLEIIIESFRRQKILNGKEIEMNTGFYYLLFHALTGWSWASHVLWV